MRYFCFFDQIFLTFRIMSRSDGMILCFISWKLVLYPFVLPTTQDVEFGVTYHILTLVPCDYIVSNIEWLAILRWGSFTHYMFAQNKHLYELH